jgi:probable phosphoglycerate mutase
MTRLLLIHAGPTPWDLEDRLVGNHPLPLTEEARASIEELVKDIPHAVSAVFRSKKNEACDQAARIVATALKLRPSDNAALNEINLGLWQGLTRGELQFRFPTVFPHWQQNPLSVNPPEGEPLADATQRIQTGLKRIVRRWRSMAVIIILRPMAMQIASGLLRGEGQVAIAEHLHITAPAETIELSDEQAYRFISA